MKLVQQLPWREWDVRLWEDGGGGFKLGFEGGERAPTDEERYEFFQQYDLSVTVTKTSDIWNPPKGQPSFMS